MTTWILIAFLSYGGRTAAITVEINNERACRSAMAAIAKEHEFEVRIYSRAV